MRPIRTILLVSVLPILASCGSVQIILKPPVQDRCASTGLQGCAELTEGVLLYVEGDKVGGKAKLTSGAAQNAPEKVKQFAQALRELKKVPGIEAHVKPLMEVADILAKGGATKGGAKAAKGKKGGGFGRGDTEAAAYAADEATARREGGTVVPGGGVSCGMLPGYAYCSFLAQGPLVITELVTGGDCPAEVVVAASRVPVTLTSLRWVVRDPAGLDGQRGFVRPDESLFVGVQGAGAADPRCTLTWSGYRPNH